MMQSLGNFLQGKQNQSPLIKGVNAALTVEAANAVLSELFGSAIGQSASAAYFKNDIVCIACLSSTAAQAIKIREAEFLEKMKSKVPAVTIKKIRYLV